MKRLLWLLLIGTALGQAPTSQTTRQEYVCGLVTPCPLSPVPPKPPKRDVPAIQKTPKETVYLINPDNCVDGGIDSIFGWRCVGNKYWTCADENRSLHVSVNGKSAWCSLPDFELDK